MKLRRRTLILFTTAVAAAIAISLAQLGSLQMGKTKIPDMKEPRLVIRKSARTLDVYDGPTLVKTFTVVLGFSPEMDKETEGDGRTPEGEFYVFAKNPKSRFHVSLGLSYPAPEDAERGMRSSLINRDEYAAIVKANAERGMPPQKTALGGEIYSHGGGTANDWTDGCIALKDEEMTELFNAIPVGTRVRIDK